MRDQFVGDVGDFGKYGLLRRLTGLTDPETPDPDLTLGVVWYYRPDVFGEGSNPVDGNRRACDPDLWDELRRLVQPGNRFVRCVEQSPILPAGTRYFRDLLSFAGVSPGELRRQHRSEWLQRALRATEGVDIVYLDPDIGLLPRSKDIGTEDGCQYADHGDVLRFLERGQSVVLYQTIRGKSVKERVADVRKISQLKPIALQYGTRLFLIIPQPQHRERIEARIRRMRTGAWGRHFTEV